MPNTHNSGRIYRHSGHPPALGCMQLGICYGVQSIDVFLLLRAIITYTSWYMLMCDAQSEHLFRNLHWRQIKHRAHPRVWLRCAYRCHLYSEQVMCSLFRNELLLGLKGWEEGRRMPGWSVCAPTLLSPFLAPFHDLCGKLQITPPSEAIPSPKPSVQVPPDPQTTTHWLTNSHCKIDFSKTPELSFTFLFKPPKPFLYLLIVMP